MLIIISAELMSNLINYTMITNYSKILTYYNSSLTQFVSDSEEFLRSNVFTNEFTKALLILSFNVYNEIQILYNMLIFDLDI